VALSEKISNKRPLEVWRALRTGSINRRIFGALITVASLTTITRLVSGAKELIVAWKFGTSDTFEAFLIAFLIPFVAINIVAHSFNFALIPVYIRVREREGGPAAQRLLSGFTVWSLILLGLATVLIIALAPTYLRWIASGFDDTKLGLTVKLTYILAPTVLVGGVVGIWAAVLNAGERFALVALTPIITPVVSVSLLLSARSLGVFALAFGVLIGSVLEMLVLGAALRLRGISLRPRWHGLDSHQRQLAGQFSPRIVATIVGSGSTVINRSMAAMLPAGSVAALNYGNKVTGSLITIFGAALGAAVAPYLSNMVARGDWSGVSHTLRRYIALIFLFAVPLVVLLFIFSQPIVSLLFQRGSFTARDSSIVSKIQAIYALQIPIFLAMVLMSRLLSSLLASNVAMWAAALNLVLNVILNVVFIRQIGVAGIALSMTCGTLVTFCFMSYQAIRLLRKRASDPHETI
jgi:putative peptidoglycan lipid II flippase